MFVLAAAHLLLVAGLIHRAQQLQVTALEIAVLYAGLAVLWPVFVGEAIVGVLRRDRTKPLRPVVLRAVLVSLMPPFRMGLTDPRVGKIWLPRLGWQPPGKDLYKRIDRAFSGPMILFALLILPVLGLEYFRAEQVRNTPWLALTLHIGIAVIWVAFATEFVLESSAAPDPLTHVKERWLDLAIVVLPMLEFVLVKWVDAAPLARLLRLGRALSPEQLTALQQVYRLRGVLTKAWQAFLILGGMGRLLGNVDQKRLRAVEGQIATLEEELAALRKEADELRAKIAEKAGAEAPRG
jgi:voltage-gated potassium channel